MVNPDAVKKAEEAAFKAAYDALSGADYDEVHTAVGIALDAYRAALPAVHIVFDAPPSPEGARFIEVEDCAGNSISIGEWRSRADGLAELVIPAAYRMADAMLAERSK